MVNGTAIGLGLLLLMASDSPGREPVGPIESAMGKEAFPWYDASKDAVKAIALPADPPSSRASSSSDWSLGSLGDTLSFLGLLAGLAALIALLVWFWRIYEPNGSGDDSQDSKASGEPSRVEALPAGMIDPGLSDPWAETLRRRDRGDLAGAVVCLFAHQLLTLSRLGLVRLAPGKTGRQLLRSVVDAEFRSKVHPTLRLFEAVYYGHRTPSPEEFATAWDAAQAFERRVAGGVGP